MKAIVALLGMFIVCCIVLGGAQQVGAFEERPWTGSPPVVQYDTPFAVEGYSNCPTAYQDVAVIGVGDSVRTCMYATGPLRFGVFLNGSSRHAVIGFAYDSGLHVLDGVCEEVDCQYSPDQDILVTQQRISQFGWGIKVYTHVSERITRTVTAGASSSAYSFDATNPDYEIKNDIGQYVATRSYALSANGEWVIIELPGKGLALLNTKMFTTRHITLSGYQYGVGMDPTEELAVSNDGLSVIVTGMNAGFAVYDVLPDCGQPLIGSLSQIASKSPCPSSDVGIGTTFPGFHSAYRPRFSANGRSFSIEILLWMQSPGRRVTYGIAGSSPVSSTALLALGDSFISGEGESDTSYYLARTDGGVDNCHVSRRSYPFLLAASIGAVPGSAKSVACAGARVQDVTGESGSGNVAQSSFAELYQPDIMMVGVGGNDAGLMGKLRVCAMPGTCEWAVGEGRQKSAREIKGLFDRLVALYEELARLSPASRIYAFGYPDALNPNGACDPITALLFTSEERIYMQESIRYVNQVISMAAAQAGIKYIEIQDAFGDNRLCDRMISTAMNGVVAGNDIAPISALPQLKVISSGSFHPTPTGHQMIASAVLGEYPHLEEYEWCSGGVLLCPVNIGVPEPSAYWDVTAEYDGLRAYIDDIFSFVKGATDRIKISLRTNSVMPGSQVRIELRSEPTVLGTLIADQYGAAEGELILPLSVQPGAHTVHAFGTSPDGTAIDVYQFIDINEQGQATPTVSTKSMAGSGSSPPAPQIAERELATMRTADPSVLGAQTSNNSDRHVPVSSPASTIVDKPKEPTVQHTFPLWVWIGAAIGLVVMVLVMTILVRRRWVKRVRSV